MPELREIVHTFKDPTRCDLCNYVNPNSDKVVKHIALGHSKLYVFMYLLYIFEFKHGTYFRDEMLSDEDLVQRKRALASTKPKKENLVNCPICNIRDPPRGKLMVAIFRLTTFNIISL